MIAGPMADGPRDKTPMPSERSRAPAPASARAEIEAFLAAGEAPGAGDRAPACAGG